MNEPETQRQHGQATPPPSISRTYKDSVFTDLFSRREYTYRLYRDLHPEDTTATPDDIQIVTLQNIMTSGQYNDLGFSVGDRLIVLVEEQSTWNGNIALRALLYATQTIRDWAMSHGADLYGKHGVTVPRPELYVLYVGQRRDVPQELRFSQLCVEGARSDIEAVVHVLTNDTPGIVGEYTQFTQTVESKLLEQGRTREAMLSALRECESKGILKDYLVECEKEVIDIMMTLFSEEEILRNHIASVEREAVERGMARGMAEGMAKGVAEGMAKGVAEGRAEGIVRTAQLFGASLADAAKLVANALGIGEEMALVETKRYWA